MAASSGTLVADPVHDLLALFLVQVVVILVLVRILAKLLAKLNQPPVIGEIIAGILLGPSCFGFIPGFSDNIFPPKPSTIDARLTTTASSADILDIFAQVGLIFFMFFLGLEVDPILLTRSWKSATPIAISSILCPFGIGAGFSFYLINVEDTSADQVTFLLFMGTCLSFTAFPVLARILTSFRLIEHAFGLQCLSIAAIDDVLAWCTLAITLSYAGGGSAVQGVYTMLITAAFVCVLIFIIRPFLIWVHPLFHHSETVSRDYVALLFLLLCMAAIWTEITGVHAFFGAFAFGIIVPKDPLVVHDLAPKIELLIVEFFLPLYFAESGLRTDLGALNTGSVWGIAFALVALATIGKMIPVIILSRFTSKWFGMPMEATEEERLAAEKRLSQFSQRKASAAQSAESANHQKPTTDNHTPHPSHVVNIPETDDVQIELTISPASAPTTKPAGLKPVASSSCSVIPDAENTGSLNGANDDSTAATMKPTSDDDDGGLNERDDSVDAELDLSATDLGNSNIVFRYEYLDWRTCFSLGLMMNTRGLVALIALNIGRDNNILGPKIFTMLVLMALITTFITSPILQRVYVKPFRQEQERRIELRRQRQREVSRAYGDEAYAAQLEAEEEERRLQREEEEELAAAAAQNRLSISIRPESAHFFHRAGSFLQSPSVSLTSKGTLRAHTAQLPYQPPPRHSGPIRLLASLYEPPTKPSDDMMSSTNAHTPNINGHNASTGYRHRTHIPQSRSMQQIHNSNFQNEEKEPGNTDGLDVPSSMVSGVARDEFLDPMDSVQYPTEHADIPPRRSPVSDRRVRIRFRDADDNDDENAIIRTCP